MARGSVCITVLLSVVIIYFLVFPLGVFYTTIRIVLSSSYALS